MTIRPGGIILITGPNMVDVNAFLSFVDKRQERRLLLRTAYLKVEYICIGIA